MHLIRVLSAMLLPNPRNNNLCARCFGYRGPCSGALKVQVDAFLQVFKGQVELLSPIVVATVRGNDLDLRIQCRHLRCLAVGTS